MKWTLLIAPFALLASPHGERLIHGDARIDRPSANLLEVQQMSQRAIVEWDDFSLSPEETAVFFQPNESAAILNKVTGGNLSEIYGKMESNGQIFLVNPHGVMVGESGKIDCASFLGSALDVDNQSFLGDGQLLFAKGGEGRVENFGEIKASKVYLLDGHRESGDIYIAMNDEPEMPMIAVNREATFVRREVGRVFLEPEFVAVTGTPFTRGGFFVEETLEALQQFGSVVPERLWYQEFALLMASGFQATVDKLSDHPTNFASRPAVWIGSSKYYFLEQTVSGDPVRIGDEYTEFLESPYWKTPHGVRHLNYLQHKAIQ